MPKIQVYEPPKYPKPPGFEESTGVFEANEDGISVLDMTGSRSGWMGSTSMFGSQMTGLNSRTDLRKAFDRIAWPKLFEALAQQGVSTEYRC